MDQPRNDQASSRTARVPRGIRTELHTVSAAELRELNRHRHRLGRTSYAMVGRALRAIERADPPAEERLLSWATHPDERVPLALVRSGILDSLSLREARASILGLIERALQDADQYVWTPLLDAICVADLWPDYWWELTASPSAEPRPPFPTRAEYIAGRVQPWVRSQTVPEALRLAVRAFSAHEFLRAVASHASALDASLVADLIGKREEAVWWLALGNGEIPRGAKELLLRHLAQIAARPDQVDAEGKGSRTFVNLTGPGFLLTDHQIVALQHIFEDRVRRLLPQRFERKQYPQNMAFALLAVFFIDGKSEQAALHYIEAAAKRNEPERVRRFFLTHDAPITVSFGRQALQWFGDDQEICLELASNPELRADPEIRAHLLRCGFWKVAAILIRDARPEEFRDLFRLIASAEPREAASILEIRSDFARTKLDSSDLVPLLEAKDPEVRLQAVAFLGELRPRDETPRKMPRP